MSAFGGKADITATGRNFNLRLRKSSGSLAIFAGIRRFAEIRPPTRGSAPAGPGAPIVEIAIDKATAAELQPSNDTFKKDEALVRR
jgi:hypothetical protein